jgi:hypothetical protein
LKRNDAWTKVGDDSLDAVPAWINIGIHADQNCVECLILHERGIIPGQLELFSCSLSLKSPVVVDSGAVKN